MSSNEIENILGYSDDKEILFTVLSADRIEEAIKMHEISFYAYEPICNSFEIASNPVSVREFNQFTRLIAEEGISVVAIDLKSNKVAGASFNKLQTKTKPDEECYFENVTKDLFQTEEAKGAINCVIKCDEAANFFERYNVNKFLEIVMVTVSPDFRKRNIGFELIKHDLKLLDRLSRQTNGPILATSMFTSEFTTRIGRALQFDTVTTLSFDNFEFKAIKCSEKIDPIHKRITMVAKTINTF